MAALNFPDTPAVGDTYGSSGQLWRWNGTRWESTYTQKPTATATGITRGISQSLTMLVGAGTVVNSGSVYTIASGTVTFQAGHTYRILGWIRAQLGYNQGGHQMYYSLNGGGLLAGADAYHPANATNAPGYSSIFHPQVYTSPTTVTGTLTWNYAPNNQYSYVSNVWGDGGSSVLIEDVTPGIDAGVQGLQGIQGPQGLPGLGVPAGGTVGQILAKNSSADNDTSWQPPGATSSNSITNVHLTDMAPHTFKGNNAGVTGDPKDLTIAELQAELGVPTPVWTNATLLSPWVYAGSNRPANGYAKSGPRVDVRVAASGGSSGSAIFTLPSTHWPGGTLDFMGRDSGSQLAIFNIDNTGNIRWYGNAAANTLCSAYMSYLIG